MTTAVMRAQLIAFLSNADERKIKGLYSLLEENIIEQSSTEELTKAELTFLNKERKLHFSGKSKSYTWEETKEFIRNKKAS